MAEMPSVDLSKCVFVYGRMCVSSVIYSMEKAPAQTEQQMPGQPGLASLPTHKQAPY